MGNFEELNKYFKKTPDVIASIKIVKKQAGITKTFCGKCKKSISYKLLDFSKKNPFGYNHTYKCNCGIRICYYIPPDKFHKEESWLEIFKSKYQEKEKNYIKIVDKNGKTKFIK